MRFLVLVSVLAASPALAQQVWTPAPVPAVGSSNTVAPIERAGRATGPDRSAPFSDLPTGSTAAGGSASANQGDGVGTPSLSR
jgi:hypothetical protein